MFREICARQRTLSEGIGENTTKLRLSESNFRESGPLVVDNVALIH